jgi:hypothetical protein
MRTEHSAITVAMCMALWAPPASDCVDIDVDLIINAPYNVNADLFFNARHYSQRSLLLNVRRGEEYIHASSPVIGPCGA